MIVVIFIVIITSGSISSSGQSDRLVVVIIVMIVVVGHYFNLVLYYCPCSSHIGTVKDLDFIHFLYYWCSHDFQHCLKNKGSFTCPLCIFKDSSPRTFYIIYYQLMNSKRRKAKILFQKQNWLG